jgi:fatty acid synthase, animal type
MSETNGRGVDIVLNSLAEEKLQASLRCLGLNGRFLEIGKFDLNNNTPMGMSVFLKNTSFHGILLDSVMEGDECIIKQVVTLVNEVCGNVLNWCRSGSLAYKLLFLSIKGIKNGAVRPLKTSVFNEQQIEQAFR